MYLLIVPWLQRTNACSLVVSTQRYSSNMMPLWHRKRLADPLGLPRCAQSSSLKRIYLKSWHEAANTLPPQNGKNFCYVASGLSLLACLHVRRMFSCCVWFLLSSVIIIWSSLDHVALANHIFFNK